MDAYVARQPIFDRKKALFAYELLFRDGLDNYMPKIDGDTATSKLLSSSFFTIGMDKIGAGKRTFINFTQRLIETDVPMLFPRETTVVEILEDVRANPKVVEACKKLTKAGYYLALDDFVFDLNLQPLINIADIIKIDFRITPQDEIRKILQTVGQKKIKFLAEKVETIEEFNTALSMGFDFFQGYFFSKPEIIKGRELSSTSIQYLNIMAEINKPEFDLNELEKIISRDISMSYKLLRHVNSAYYRRSSTIESLKQALLIMGKDEVSRIVSLIALSNLSPNKPDELLKSACIKANLCEKLGSFSDCHSERGDLFIVGLFSNLDAILDQPMSEIMDKLPLSDAIKDALVFRKGDLSNFLNLAEHYEHGNWDKIRESAAKCCVIESAIPAFYVEACELATEFGF